MGGVVAKSHAPPQAGTGEHVEVVERVTGSGDARPVVAAGDAKNVTIAHDHVDVDAPVGRVGAVEGEPLGAGTAAAGAPGAPDPEVIESPRC